MKYLKAKEIISFIYNALFKIRFFFRSMFWIAENKLRKKSNKIYVTGFFNEPMGIGRGAHLTADAFTQLGFEVTREDIRPFHHQLLSSRAFSNFNSSDAPTWVIHANPHEAKIALYTHANERWANLYKIAYWAWESDCAPASWVPVAKWFDEIWVPSHFVAAALSKAFKRAQRPNYITKILVMPHLVPAAPNQIEHNDNYVTALSLFDPRSDFERKNPEGVIKAWLKAFPEPSPTARLVIKSYKNAAHYPELKSVVAKTQFRPDIKIITETLDDEETRAFISQFNILISLHRGEGFGLTLAEAMSFGMLVIATGWSGNMDFMNQENSMLVPFEIVPANKRYNGPVAHWADPDILQAAAIIKQAISDSSLRHRVGQRARHDIQALAEIWKAQQRFLMDT